MKVLLSAYACEPGRGSEPEVGLLTLLAAAQAHEVWVLTRQNNLEALRRHLADDPRADRIHLVGLDLGPRWQAVKRRGRLGLYLYYDEWQRAAGLMAADLHRRVRFDLVHHVTFAADWTRVGVAGLDAPLVWGPVGGGVRTPPSLLPALGATGAAADVVRVMGSTGARVVRRIRRERPDRGLVLAQNPETARRLAAEDTVVLPNVVATDFSMPTTPGDRGADIAVAGRLVAWKAGVLAVRAFAHVTHPAARLVFYGEGPQAERIMRSARRRGIADRVEVAGPLPRRQLLDRLAAAGVLLHPSLHEEAGMAVAEALAMGTPVVCLDHGGPRELLRWWPGQPSTAVAPDTMDATARALGEAIDRWLANPPPIPAILSRPVAGFEAVLADAYQRAAGHEAE